MAKKTFEITISKESIHTFTVEADNIDEATEKATAEAYDFDGWDQDEPDLNVIDSGEV